MIIFDCFNIIFKIAVIPLWYQHIQQPLVFVEDREVSFHSSCEVEIKRTSYHLPEACSKLFSLTLNKSDGFCYDIHASPVLSYTTGCSFLPLIQQDVAVGASIEVPFGSVTGPSVAYPWVGFAFHAGLFLDSQRLSNYNVAPELAGQEVV